MLITYTPTLLYKKLVAPSIYHLKFSYPENPEWTFTAGQYMILHVPQGDGHPARRLYSIASSPTQKESLDFIIEILPNGLGSMLIEALQVGQEATWQGPAGLFTYKSEARQAVYLATGTGIAPIYSMIMTKLQSDPQTAINLFWGLKTCEDSYLTDELTTLAKSHPGFYFRTCLSRVESLDQVKAPITDYTVLGHVTNGLEKLTTDSQRLITDFDYYLCGSKHVVESLREYLAEKMVPKEQIFFEKFT